MAILGKTAAKHVLYLFLVRNVNRSVPANQTSAIL